MKQCHAKTLPSTYSDVHRCLKKTGLKKLGWEYLCRHHRSIRDRKADARPAGSLRTTP